MAKVGDRSAVIGARAESPLKVLLPENHGDGRWAFVATFGGGLVDGDAIELGVHVQPGARALVGTQASTKIYRSPEKGASQRISARIDEDALLVCLPDPVVCFAGARYTQAATFELAGSASLVTVDTFSCGRAASGERWAFARYASRTQIVRAEAPLATDAIVLDPEDGPIAARMARFDAFATVFAFGPAVPRVRDGLLAAGAGPLSPRAALVAAASPIGDDGAVLRIAGERIEAVLNAIRDALAGLRDVLGDDPFARKW